MLIQSGCDPPAYHALLHYLQNVCVCVLMKSSPETSDCCHSMAEGVIRATFIRRLYKTFFLSPRFCPGERPFSCPHCNRAFADRSNLRAHLQTHAEVKKYQCGVCSRTFSRMSLLQKHSSSGCCSPTAWDVTEGRDRGTHSELRAVDTERWSVRAQLACWWPTRPQRVWSGLL